MAEIRCSPPKTNKRWFQDQFQKHDLTQRAVARKLGMDPPALSVALRGDRKFTLNEATVLASLIGVPLEEVLVNAGVRAADLPTARSRESLEISGWIDGDLKIRWGTPKGPKTAPRPAYAAKNTGVLRYQTIGSALEGMDGVLVYYVEGSNSLADCVGRLCVVRGIPATMAPESKERAGKGLNRGEYWYLATVKRGYTPGAHNLAALDGRTIAEDVIVEAAWPVIWIKM